MTHNIGSIIKKRREELKISQVSICRGICNPATLSRIEKFGYIADKAIMTQLFERLGYSKTFFDELCSENEYQIAKMIVDAKRLYSIGKFDETWALVDKLSVHYESLSLPNRQFCDIINTMLLMKKKIIAPSQAMVNLEKILRTTCPNYSITNLPQLMTFNEITTLNCISNCYDDLGRTDISINILYHIKNFHDNNIIDDSESMRTLPMILYNLSKYLGLSGKYDECIEICESSINKQALSGRCHSLPETMYNLAWSLVKRGRESDTEYAKETLINAYYTSKALKKNKLTDHIENFIKSNFPEISLTNNKN